MKWLRKKGLPWMLILGVLALSLLGANKIMHAPRPLGAPDRDQPNGAEKAGKSPAPRTGTVTIRGVVSPEKDVVPLIPSAKGEVIEVLDLAQVVDRATADPTPGRAAPRAR